MSRCEQCGSNNECFEYCGASMSEMQDEIDELRAESEKLNNQIFLLENHLIRASNGYDTRNLVKFSKDTLDTLHQLKESGYEK